MPITPTRVMSEPAMAIAPNATQGAGSTSAHDPDAPAVVEFGAALTLLLGHVAKPAGSSSVKAATAESAEAAADGTAEVSDTSAAADDAAHQSLAAMLAIPSAASAPATALAPDANAIDAKAVTRSLDLLAPEFRARLERVIERMESEFGYKVEVTETFRSQGRQNALFAQGRTDPGPVVTWTRASNHTAGRAADLIIDGSYDNPLAYERLMRVAREEGLRTLGARDPGHVELPPSPTGVLARASAAEDPASLSPQLPDAPAVIARPAPSVASLSSIVPQLSELERSAKLADSSAASSLPNGALSAGASEQLLTPDAMVATQTQGTGVARVAAVAPVAQVAAVAQVATVATVGAQAAPVVHQTSRGRAPDAESRSTARQAGDPGVKGGVVDNKALLQGVGARGTQSDASNRDTGRGGSGPNAGPRGRTRLDPAAAHDGAVEVMRQTRDELMHAVAGTDPTAATSISSGDGASAPIGHADMSERIARLLKVQDAANDRPMSQVMLRLERPDGGEDRLRVDLRGNTVSATLDVSDPAAADRLGANVKELQRALERQGLQTDSLTVRTMARTVESSTLARGAGAAVESDLQRTVGSSSTTSTNTSSRERGARHDDQQRPSPDSQRQRSRREPKGDR